jgi:serine/threonine protein kinase
MKAELKIGILVGHGTYGYVYRAERNKTEEKETVAVKVEQKKKKKIIIIIFSTKRKFGSSKTCLECLTMLVEKLVF